MKIDQKNKILELEAHVHNWFMIHEPCSIKDYSHKSTKRSFVEIRQICHYLLCKYTSTSLNEIGQYIGDKDHALVLYSKKTINNRLETDKLFYKKFIDIEQYVKRNMNLEKNIYISGTISKHLKEKGWKYVLNKFQIIEDTLIKEDYNIHNPTKFFNDEELKTFTQLQFMSRCISILVNCNFIYMLSDYKESYNACIELEIAKSLCLTIIYQDGQDTQKTEYNSDNIGNTDSISGNSNNSNITTYKSYSISCNP